MEKWQGIELDISKRGMYRVYSNNSYLRKTIQPLYITDGETPIVYDCDSMPISLDVLRAIGIDFVILKGQGKVKPKSKKVQRPTNH